MGCVRLHFGALQPAQGQHFPTTNSDKITSDTPGRRYARAEIAHKAAARPSALFSKASLKVRSRRSSKITEPTHIQLSMLKLNLPVYVISQRILRQRMSYGRNSPLPSLPLPHTTPALFLTSYALSSSLIFSLICLQVPNKRTRLYSTISIKEARVSFFPGFRTAKASCLLENSLDGSVASGATCFLFLLGKKG